MKKIFFILLLFPGVVIGQFDSDSLSNVPINKSLETTEQYEKAKSIWIKFHYYSSINHYDSCMYYGDLWLNHHIKYGTVHETIYAYYHKIKNLKKFNEQDEAFRLTLTAYDQYCSKYNNNTDCESCWILFEDLSQFMIKIKNYRQGINYFNNGCIPQKSGKSFYWKARLYVLLDEPDSALIQTLESIRIAQIENIPNNLVAAYNQHALIAKGLEKYDDAIVAFSKAIELVDSLELDERRYGYLMGNLGSCYYQKGDFDAAYNYLQIDVDKSKKREQDIESYLNAEIMLIEIDLKRKDHKLALYRLDGLMEVEELFFTPLQKLTVLDLYMQVFKLNGNQYKYEFYLNQLIASTKAEATSRIDVSQNLSEQLSVNRLEKITKQIENEKQLLSQQLIINEQESRFQKWLLIAGTLFIVLVALFFLYSYRKRALLKDTLFKLAKKEQDILKLKVQEESRNVNILSQELMGKQELSKKIIDKLKYVEGINKPTLKNIEFFIDNELGVKSIRASIQNQIGRLSDNFYVGLKIKHAKLTDLELKLAAMVVMKMSNKDIALSRSITLESSKKAKNRLKKKLGVPPDGDLSAYLNSFL